MIHFQPDRIRAPLHVQAINVAQVRGARIDALGVDRQRFLGAEGEWWLKQMTLEPEAEVMEERLRQIRASDTEWTLTTWRRLIAKGQRELPTREPMPRRPEARR